MSRRRLEKRLELLESRADRERMRRLAAMGDVEAGEAQRRSLARRDMGFIDLLELEVKRFRVPGYTASAQLYAQAPGSRRRVKAGHVEIKPEFGEFDAYVDLRRKNVLIKRFQHPRERRIPPDVLEQLGWRVKTSMGVPDIDKTLTITSMQDAARKTVDAIEELVRATLRRKRR